VRCVPPASQQPICSQIGTPLCDELKGMRSDRSHSNYNVAHVCDGCGETHERRSGGGDRRQIPTEIQQEAVDLDEKYVRGSCVDDAAVAAAAQRAGRGEGV
jgi:hypothetical protein